MTKRVSKEELQKPTRVTKRFLKHVERKAGIALIRSKQNKAQDDAGSWVVVLEKGAEGESCFL